MWPSRPCALACGRFGQPMTRVDRILAELRARHDNDDRFAERLRPMLERIVDPAVSEACQVGLLELVAETCERNTQIRTDGKAALVAWGEYVQSLIKLLRGELPPESGAGSTG